MPNIFFINAAGESKQVVAGIGQNVMQVAMDNMIEGIDAECGGSCSCGTCHCYLESEWSGIVNQPAEEEIDTLECVANFQEGKSRLSCQLMVTEESEGLKVYLPESQGF